MAYRKRRGRKSTKKSRRGRSRKGLKSRVKSRSLRRR